MDTIWQALQYSLMLDIILVCVAVYAVSQLTSRTYADVRPEDLVPEHKRFERREGETGDRRESSALRFQGAERRLAARRVTA